MTLKDIEGLIPFKTKTETGYDLAIVGSIPKNYEKKYKYTKMINSREFKKHAIKEVKDLKERLSSGIWINIKNSSFIWNDSCVNDNSEYLIIGHIEALCQMFNLKNDDVSDLRIGQIITNELLKDIDTIQFPPKFNIKTNKLFNMSDTEFKCRYVI